MPLPGSLAFPWRQLLWAGPGSESRSVLQSLQSLTMSIYSLNILVAKCNLTNRGCKGRLASHGLPFSNEQHLCGLDFTLLHVPFKVSQSCITSTQPSQIASSVHSQPPCTQRTRICVHGLCLHSSDSCYSLKHGSNWGQEAESKSTSIGLCNNCCRSYQELHFTTFEQVHRS